MPERVLWSYLRGRGLASIKFRLQYQVGPYVVDFYCAAATLAVELDGERHADRREHDERRDTFLRGQSVSVLRFRFPRSRRGPKLRTRAIMMKIGKRYTHVYLASWATPSTDALISNRRSPPSSL